MLFGDSLMSGYGLKTEDSFAVVLSKNLRKLKYDVEVINTAQSGSTTSAGLRRVKWALKQFVPHIAIICLGGNDMLRGIPPEKTYENLDAMLKIMHDKGFKVILVQVKAPENYDPIYAEKFNKIYPELGAKYGVPVYPFFLEGIFGNSGYMQEDGIHPNARGVQYIVYYLTQYLVATKWMPEPVNDAGPGLPPAAPATGSPAAAAPSAAGEPVAPASQKK